MGHSAGFDLRVYADRMGGDPGHRRPTILDSLGAIALAIIALAEYLWRFDVQPERLPVRRHEIIRTALVVIGGIIFTGAIDGGLALFRGAFDQYLSLEWLAGTPFTDYRTPALALIIVVGGSSLLAATTAFVHREWALLVSMAVGAVMVGYLFVEALVLDSKVGDAFPFVVALQAFYFVLGVAMLGLGTHLRTREFPRKRLYSEQAFGTSHA
jgi:hypothetical protein